MASSSEAVGQKKTSAARNARLGALHARVGKLGLSDEEYRDRLEREFGVRSARELNDAQLDQALEKFHVKPRAGVPHRHQRKVRALWIALGNLGAVDRSDAALDAFIERQTGKQRLAFVTPADAAPITEALKEMCAREGFVIPKSDEGGLETRRALLKAQWQKLAKLGAVKNAHHWALESWASWRLLKCHGASLASLDRAQLDEGAKALGVWLRKQLSKSGAASEAVGGQE